MDLEPCSIIFPYKYSNICKCSCIVAISSSPEFGLAALLNLSPTHKCVGWDAGCPAMENNYTSSEILINWPAPLTIGSICLRVPSRALIYHSLVLKIASWSICLQGDGTLDLDFEYTASNHSNAPLLRKRESINRRYFYLFFSTCILEASIALQTSSHLHYVKCTFILHVGFVEACEIAPLSTSWVTGLEANCIHIHQNTHSLSVTMWQAFRPVCNLCLKFTTSSILEPV